MPKQSFVLMYQFSCTNKILYFSSVEMSWTLYRSCGQLTFTICPIDFFLFCFEGEHLIHKSGCSSYVECPFDLPFGFMCTTKNFMSIILCPAPKREEYDQILLRQLETSSYKTEFFALFHLGIIFKHCFQSEMGLPIYWYYTIVTWM